jgi:protein ImuB
MLWIGLHLPLLSLESCEATLPPGSRGHPLALLDDHVIAHANAAALALGVKPGLKRATALALAPQLRLAAADAARDAQSLAAVAHAALAFTPAVTMSPPQGVLLEVRASQRCFGGFDRLLHRLRRALAPLGHEVRVASAPTAQGAALLSRCVEAGVWQRGDAQSTACASDDRRARATPTRARSLHCADLAAVDEALSRAPVWLLGPGREHWEALQGMGLRTIADLRGLPRAGLARRFGEALLDELDRALGIRPDPRVWIELPPVFDSRLELFARADTAEQVLHGAGVLLARLLAWARAQHARVRSFALEMQHEPRHRIARDGSEAPSCTRLEMALAEPSGDAAHLLALLRERLARTQLAAPTLELRLHCSDIARGAPPNEELFPTPRSEREGLTRLIERLQARLGAGQVQRLVRLQDHRPERANAMCPLAPDAVRPLVARAKRPAGADAAGSAVPGMDFPGSAVPRAGFPDQAARGMKLPGSAGSMPPAQDPLQGVDGTLRPVWLLREPRPLRERDDQPLLDGVPLQLLCGPERIESGWWDGALAQRDYFIAQRADGALVWVFRGRLPLAADGGTQGWYLQGLFG